ncbi:hypothetical protein M407DRAFT_244265 [Tulasnella calospora MUT 4182]|uniref:Ricin B lectin domain-containing protein n=1 Tax=Tulasnella calospora MUT 4182 TaxID=1051891 RepID=A0A0C3LU32_9AGAM|nr:hypothetical protein M407DRAFT_244265 [Tulasnella calospora MUT 4182]
MKSTPALTAAAAAFFALGVKAAPADSQTCYTVHSGYFAVHPNGGNEGVTLNQNNQVVYGQPGTPIQVDFQACPTLLGNWPDEDIHIGRILVGSDCLTIDNPDSATEPYFASVAACSSDVTPSAGETWSYGNSDDRGVVYWRGSLDSYGHVGYIPKDSTGTPLTTADHLLEVGCDHECINFNIVAQLD